MKIILLNLKNQSKNNCIYTKECIEKILENDIKYDITLENYHNKKIGIVKDLKLEDDQLIANIQMNNIVRFYNKYPKFEMNTVVEDWDPPFEDKPMIIKDCDLHSITLVKEI